MKRFDPKSITAIGMIAFLVWAWLGMSSSDYQATSTGDGRQTAGWFVLGLPLLAPIALLSSMPFSLLARSGRPAVAWILMAILFGSMIWIAYTQSTPQARLARALGVEISENATIVWLRESDSFNDGSTTFGACTADANMVADVVTSHSLVKAMTARDLRPYMPDINIPADGIGFRSDRLKCYYDADSGTLYFVRRYSDPRP